MSSVERAKIRSQKRFLPCFWPHFGPSNHYILRPPLFSFQTTIPHHYYHLDIRRPRKHIHRSPLLHSIPSLLQHHQIPRQTGRFTGNINQIIHLVLRNCCAHHSRLSNHVFPVKTKMPERMPNTWIADFSFREQTLYPQLCCVVYWLNSIVLENTFITDFKQLLISHPSVKTRLLGFPRNWEQEPLWR